MSQEPVLNFVLVGPNAGKTIGFCKGPTGVPRYSFVNGVMSVHATRVNGRFIMMMKQLYSAYLEGEVPKDGSSEVQQPRADAGGSEEVGSDLTQASEHPAAGTAIQLGGDDGADSGAKEPEAKAGNGSSSKASRKRKTKA
jgi:hypothetical protein